MKKPIDPISILLGLGSGVLVMLATGATTSQPVGRYQIAGAANYFMLVDSATGQVWGGNFNQLGQGQPGLEFKPCVQNAGSFFEAKP